MQETMKTMSVTRAARYCRPGSYGKQLASHGRASLWIITIIGTIATLSCQSFLFPHADFGRNRRPSERVHNQLMHMAVSELSDLDDPQQTELQAPTKWLIHWRGEDVEGYSIQFRHIEFFGAISSVLGRSLSLPPMISFHNALKYDASAKMSDIKVEAFNSAMQYMELTEDCSESDREALSVDTLVKTVERCSLVHALYQVVAAQDTYDELSPAALTNGGFQDLMVGGDKSNSTWCMRVRYYGDMSTEAKAKRYSARARSMTLEKEALHALKPLLLRFGGKVNLQDPDCKIYVFDGLLGQKKVLARRFAIGPQVFSIAPNTRICITNTPLCPIAAFALCNVAGVREGHAILDPYAGSCATLLAAAMIAPTCKTVGIEIAHDGLVNRQDIGSDFSTRGLVPPLALLQGDCTNSTMRDQARAAIGDESFDLVITDPPYGIRESKNHNELPPLVELFRSMEQDREAGTPLLKKGGRLVAFVPCHMDEILSECLPTQEQMQAAGLKLEVMREQPLNDKLSRWLVAFSCIK